MIGVNEVGRDEHTKSRGKNTFAQTPKNQLKAGTDVEFSQAFADEDDKEAQRRARAAERRVKDNEDM